MNPEFTCDANGNITQLVGRNVDTGAIWKIAHTMGTKLGTFLISP